MNIGIVGAAGRMGKMLIAAVTAADGARLVGGTEAPGHADLGHDLGELAGVGALDIALTPDTNALFHAADVVIDFTVPAATATHAALAVELNTALVIGTTGLDATAQGAITKAAKKVAIVQAANYSVGVNLLLGLAKRAAETLGDDFDIEISEIHHRHKIDAPSGTALALGHAVAEGRGVELNARAVMSREGITGERKAGDIGFATMRGGDVVGDHTVLFAGAGERLELTHKAASRDIFASGAVYAALWTGGKKPGLYSMNDVLGF